MRRAAFASAASLLAIGLLSCMRDDATAPMSVARAPRTLAAASATALIAFASNRAGTYHIFTIAPDGSSLTQLTSGSANDYEPVWSPDGRRIAFVSDRNTRTELYSMNADGSGVTRLTFGDSPATSWQRVSSFGSHPAWSPDAGRIAVTMSADDRWLGVITTNTPGGYWLVPHSDMNLNPSWSPDGRRVVYERHLGSVPNAIFAVNPDGSGSAALTDTVFTTHYEGAVEPSWSPDGSLIAWVGSITAGSFGIWVMRPDGSGKTRLDNNYNGRQPTWSPDGRRIAFISNQSGTNQLYVMNADGSSTARITNGGNDDINPSWQPTSPGSGGVASVAVSPSSATGSLGQSAQFTATAYDASGNVVSGKTATWRSTDSTLVSVSTTGFGRAVGVGNATLVATIDGIQGQAQTTVTGVPIASIRVDPFIVVPNVGMSGSFTATLRAADGSVLTGRRVLWTSTYGAIVQIDSTGFTRALGYGYATVTATSGGKTDTAIVEVNRPPVAVTSLDAGVDDDSTVTLGFREVDGSGGPVRYTVRYAPQPIAWGSAPWVTRGTCATPIAGAGYGNLWCSVKGLRPATAYDFQLVAYRSTPWGDVYSPLSNIASATTPGSSGSDTTSVAYVTVSPGSASATVGQSGQFTATVTDAYGNPLFGRSVTWSSTDTTVVTVTSAGYATGVGVGSAEIVAAAGGKSGRAQVTISGAGLLQETLRSSPR